jgi:hypothetical protein
VKEEDGQEDKFVGLRKKVLGGQDYDLLGDIKAFVQDDGPLAIAPIMFVVLYKTFPNLCQIVTLS